MANFCRHRPHFLRSSILLSLNFISKPNRRMTTSRRIDDPRTRQRGTKKDVDEYAKWKWRHRHQRRQITWIIVKVFCDYFKALALDKKPHESYRSSSIKVVVGIHTFTCGQEDLWWHILVSFHSRISMFHSLLIKIWNEICGVKSTAAQKQPRALTQDQNIQFG